MKILHIYKDYYPVVGGIENHVRVLAEAGAALGHDVTVLVTSRDRHTRRETLNGVRLIKTSRWVNVSSTPISPAMFWEARKLGHTAEVIHSALPVSIGRDGALVQRFVRQNDHHLSQRHRAPEDAAHVYQPFLWRILRQADRIIATSGRYIDTSRI